METNPNIQKFIDIIDDAVALNIVHQYKNEDSKRYIAPAHWLAEFGTVEINMGRACGKSRYISKRATPADLVICRNEEEKRHVFKDVTHVSTARELKDVMEMTGAWRGRKLPDDMYWNKIYVDEPQLIFRDRLAREAFFELISDRCNQVIMLGTPSR